MSTLDEMFREKLADHSLPPSGDAWQRVEKEISKKNNQFLWIRIAAVFLLAALMLGFYSFTRRTDPVTPLGKVTTPEIPKGEIKEKAVPQILKQESKSGKAPQAKLTPQQSAPARVEKERVAAAIVEPELSTPARDQEVKATSASRPIVLVFTLAPLHSPENPEMEEAAANKEGSLKKVMDFAKNVAETSPVGELRTMKQDLFALDFKKKTNSKKQ